MEIGSYLMLPPWCSKTPKTVLDLVHLKKDDTNSTIYQQLSMKKQTRMSRRPWICLVEVSVRCTDF